MTWIKGNKPTEEHRRKISKKLKGIKRKKFTEEHRLKLSLAKKIALSDPTKHSNWKGDKASYRAVHAYIVRHFGKATHCELCKKEGERIHWANLDHKYSRERKDWQMMCAKCHGNYDKVNKLRKNSI